MVMSTIAKQRGYPQEAKKQLYHEINELVKIAN